jgi:uncharacterized protein (DUF362 family)
MSCSRRQFLGAAAVAAITPRFLSATPSPAARVAIAKTKTYGPELIPLMDRMFDQIGGIAALVRGKTVAIKLNLTGSPKYRLGHSPAELAQWTHPDVIGAAVHLIGKAGAKRIRLLESPWDTAEPVEAYMMQANWEPRHLLSAAQNVEFENTNYLGNGKKYSRLWVPKGGHMFRAFDLNHSYEDCDVFVSIAKLKEHATAGVTLSMKNCFGITPCTIYGDGSGVDEPSPVPKGGRGPIHAGNRQPSKSALPENDPKSPRDAGYRVPRVVADLVAARPIHLSIVDGIESMAGGEGPWVKRTRRISPGVLIAGTNPVATDAVGMAVMGFDPMADRGTAPFESCDSTLRLAEELGAGTRDLNRIEVAGASIRDSIHRFRI